MLINIFNQINTAIMIFAFTFNSDNINKAILAAFIGIVPSPPDQKIAIIAAIKNINPGPTIESVLSIST